MADADDFVRTRVLEYLAVRGPEFRSELRPLLCWAHGEMSLEDVGRFSDCRDAYHRIRLPLKPGWTLSSDDREELAYAMLWCAGFRNQFDVASNTGYPVALVEDCCEELRAMRRVAHIPFKGVSFYAAWNDDDVKVRGHWRLFRYVDQAAERVLELTQRAIVHHRAMYKQVADLERWLRAP